MTKESPPAIDPRYDPAYQRGFSGAAASHIRAVETPRHDRAAPAQRAEAHSPRTEPQRTEPHRTDTQRMESQRGSLRSPAEERIDPFVVPPARSVPEDDLLPEPTEPEPRDEAAGPSRIMLRGNPWVAVLWVVAVLMLTAGFFGTWRSQSIYVGATPINDMNEIVMFKVLQTLSPSLVLVGLLVLGGLVFLHAVSWRGRRGEDS